MFVVKRDGKKELVMFDKITARIRKICYGLNPLVDPVKVAMRVIEGLYDGVVFHRVIDGFMAQTGDVSFGNSQNENFNIDRAGTGGSKYPDLKAEFSKLNHGRGAVSMARTQDPNSANSQFFICFGDASFLNEQYTVWGQVIEGMEFVDKIKRGDGSSGSVSDPDKIIKMQLAE